MASARVLVCADGGCLQRAEPASGAGRGHGRGHHGVDEAQVRGDRAILWNGSEDSVSGKLGLLLQHVHCGCQRSMGSPARPAQCWCCWLHCSSCCCKTKDMLPAVVQGTNHRHICVVWGAVCASLPAGTATYTYLAATCPALVAPVAPAVALRSCAWRLCSPSRPCPCTTKSPVMAMERSCEAAVLPVSAGKN